MNRGLLREAKPEVIGRITLVLVALALLLGIGATAKALYSSAQSKGADLRVAQMNQQLREIQGSMKHVNEVLASGSQIQGPVGKPVVVKFQSSIERAGRENDVRVEFTQVGDPTLFLSRFKNEPDGTLQQIEVQMNLNGNLADVTRTLDQFSTFRIPFEFGEMQVARDSSTAGVGKVSVRVSVFVLVPNQV